jgi:hypothetical protein
MTRLVAEGLKVYAMLEKRSMALVPAPRPAMPPRR